MKTRAILVLLVLGAMLLVSTAYGATITWGATSSAPATDWFGNPLLGTSTFGQPDFSNGALVQLWLAVGEIDDYTCLIDVCRGPLGGHPYWHIDDVLLEQTHVGFGTLCQ